MGTFIGYAEALDLTLKQMPVLPFKQVSLEAALQHAVAETLYARVDAPSAHVSLKDGFAVQSEDIQSADVDHPVRLAVLETTAAGEPSSVRVVSGSAIRILSGAKIPAGADAVVANEFTQDNESAVVVTATAEKGRNILPKSSDVHLDDPVAAPGERLTPGKIGLLAAAGFDTIPVIPKPRVGIIATGSEIVPPGQPLSEGKVFASNLMTLNSWCACYGMSTRPAFVEDDADAIGAQLTRAIRHSDAVITSGGAWTSRRDWMAEVLSGLGWQKIFHRVRMGPGKAVGLGLLEEKPIFILPGGPPSNLLAFLQIALPGLLKMAGLSPRALPPATGRLSKTVRGQRDWTQFLFGRLQTTGGDQIFMPAKTASRLRDMAEAQAVLTIPEGVEKIAAGNPVQVQLLI